MRGGPKTIDFTLGSRPEDLATLKGPPALSVDTILSQSPLEIAKQYINTFSEDYQKVVSATALQLGPLPNEKQISYCIPVAGAQEASRIYRCIQSLAYQTLHADRFEVALLINFTKEDQNTRSESINALYEEIARARADFPHLDIRIANLLFESSKDISIGLLRALISDAVVTRAVEAGRTDEFAIARLDADTRAVRQENAAYQIQTYAANPKVFAIQGGLIWSPEGLEDNPALFTELAYNCLEEAVDRHRNKLSDWSGPNGSICLAAYCAVGGYRPADRFAEDRTLTEELFSLAAECPGSIAVKHGGPAMTLVTSNRRPVAAHNKGVGVSRQWEPDGPTAFSPDNHDIRARPEGTSSRSSHQSQSLNQEMDLFETTLNRLSFNALPRDLSFTRAHDILRTPLLLNRLHEAYSKRDELTERMLRKLPDGVLKYKQEIPLSIPRRSKEETEPKYRFNRQERYARDEEVALEEIALSLKKRLNNLESGLTFLYEAPTSDTIYTRTLLKDCPHALDLQLYFDGEHLAFGISEEMCKILSLEMFCWIAENACGDPRIDIEPTRIVAQKIANFIINSLATIREYHPLSSNETKFDLFVSLLAKIKEKLIVTLR